MSDRNPGPQVRLQVGGEPRADLLPPEVHEQARGRRLRRLLAVVIVVAVIVVGVAFAAASLDAAAQQTALVTAQQQTATLLTEQQKYVSAQALTTQVQVTQATQQTGGASEILWSPLYTSLKALLPSGATIVAGTFKAPSAWDPPLTLQGPSRYPHIATLVLVVESSTPIAGADMLTKLSTLPSYTDATIDSSTINKSSNTYFTGFTIDLNDKALSNRFSKASK
jgi:hypothetical protein